MGEGLAETFPQLGGLSDDELESALAERGLMGAFVRAHVKRLSSPRKVGRPAGEPKFKLVIQRRGRKSAAPLSPNSTNIQLAELARIYMEIMHCTGTEAAKATLLAINGVCKPADKRRLARLIPEVPARAHDRRIVRQADSQNGNTIIPDLSFVGQLKQCADKPK